MSIFLVLIFAAVIFTMTTSARDLLLGLTKLKVPYSFAFMLTIAIRFIPIIAKEINNVIDAQRSRAYEFVVSLRYPIKSIQNFISILIPVLMLPKFIFEVECLTMYNIVYTMKI